MTKHNSLENSAMKKGLLAKVHIGKADVALTDEEWRALILEISQNRTQSTKELKLFELENLLERLRGLGFQPLNKKPTSKQQEEAEANFRIDKQIKNLLKTLNLPRNYLAAMAKNMFSIQNLDYLQLWQKQKLVKTLENRKLRAKNDNFFG